MNLKEVKQMIDNIVTSEGKKYNTKIDLKLLGRVNYFKTNILNKKNKIDTAINLSSRINSRWSFFKKQK